MAHGSVIVVGGGIAGLASGIYAQSSGYDAVVFEMHTGPGGVCTAWQRGGYVFDGCLHWLVGGKPGTAFRPLWDEVGAVGLELVDHDRMASVRDLDGNELVFWSDLTHLEQHLREGWPAEKTGIKELVRGTRAVAKTGFDVPDVPPEMMGKLDTVRMALKYAPGLIAMRKYQEMPIVELAGCFKEPFLRRAVGNALIERRVSAMALLATLGWVDSGDACWVIGGSRVLAHKLEQRLLELGGGIEYGSRVVKVLVNDDRAVGVRLEDGTEHRADYVIGAADGHATIFDMLGGAYTDERLRTMYDTLETYPPIIQVSLGIDCDLSAEPWSVVLLLEPGTRIGGAEVEAVWMHHYSYDHSMAPPGKSCVTTLLISDLDHWEGLKAQGPEDYATAKDDVARQVIGLVERAYPSTRGRVEVVDVATPSTYVRYTGNWRASYEGWLVSPTNVRVAGLEGLGRTLPGLAGFAMAGQWISVGGGLPSAVLTGRWAVQTMCAELGTPFRAQH